MPRRRFDLAIDGITFGPWKIGLLPLMRDGAQWRPMVHVRDTARAQMSMIEADPARVNGRIFSVGSEGNVYQVGPLGELVAKCVPRDVAIEWYGDPDRRSCRVAFDRIEALSWRAEKTTADGMAENCAVLEAGTVNKTPRTVVQGTHALAPRRPRRRDERGHRRYMKVLLLGPNGQLGCVLRHAHVEAGEPFALVSSAHEQLDLSEPGTIERTLGNASSYQVGFDPGRDGSQPCPRFCPMPRPNRRTEHRIGSYHRA